jgi:transcriptional regulator with XRE-family HTH domain
MMHTQIDAFWEHVRSELRRDCGQDDRKRNRKKALRREQLAKQLGLSSGTLKGFLNGNQAALGREALFALFLILPALEVRYKEATGHPNGFSGSSTRALGDGPGVHLQMTFQFEGSENQLDSLTTRLPPGRECVLTVRISPGRVA